jgi:hypothetical protein
MSLKVFIIRGEIVYGGISCTLFALEKLHQEIGNKKMKRVLTFCIILSALFCFVGVALAEDDCPYDDDYKYALKKALVDYLKDPQTSRFSLGEVKDMLGFYLKEDSITNSKCTPEIKALVEKADKVDDSLMSLAGFGGMSRCDVCPDGTLCAEKNDKEQTCTCKDTNADNRNEYCTLKPMVALKAYCDVCPDGSLCDTQNDMGQTCYCKDANLDDQNEQCYLQPLVTWPEPCDKCDEGTQCNQTNTLGETCSCRDVNDDGVNERCMLYVNDPITLSLASSIRGSCTKCPDGTACGQVSSKNLICSCTDTNKNGKFELCKLERQHIECTQCSDATSCGRANAYNQICRCTDNDRDNRTEICALMPSNTILYKCSSCIDGTACGKTAGPNVCACQPEPCAKQTSKYYSCQLKPYCSGCADGTPCGQIDADGNACTCHTKLGNNIYNRCIPECNKCPDGTECGKIGADGKTCVCRLGASKAGRYMECLSKCDKCSDGTACYKKNKDNNICLCSGIDFKSRKYLKCEIWNKNQTTTTTRASTTTSAQTTTQISSTTLIPTTTTSTTLTPTTTTSTTLAPEEQITVANLLPCIKGKKGKLYTDIEICAECVNQKRIFYNETNPPVGPGGMVYDELAVEGSSGVIPRWVYKVGGQDTTSEGCKSLPEINGIFQCGLKKIPGYAYQEC